MLAAIDFGDFIKFVVFFFVVVLPILRTIHEAVKTRNEESRRRAESAAPATEVEEDIDADGDEARRAFEALMRGEDPARAPEPPPIPAPAPAVEAVSRRVERGRAGDLHREARESEQSTEVAQRRELRGAEARSSEGESYEEELETSGVPQPDKRSWPWPSTGVGSRRSVLDARLSCAWSASRRRDAGPRSPRRR